MRPIKTNGITELENLERRVTSARALNRIGQTDFSYLIERIQEIKSRIVSMRETDENGEELG